MLWHSVAPTVATTLPVDLLISQALKPSRFIPLYPLGSCGHVASLSVSSRELTPHLND